MTLPDDVLRELDDLLAPADAALAAGWPGEPAGRQPVHTLYLPADRAAADVVTRAGADALDAVAAEDAGSMARITGLDAALVDEVWPRVLAKLAREPVEDLRLDLEDGYGTRPDDEEDRHARLAGEVLAGLGGAGGPFASGVRVKSLEAPTRRRGVRSLDLVLGALGGALPPGFVTTLPKVTSAEQVQAMVLLCERLEAAHRLPALVAALRGAGRDAAGGAGRRRDGDRRPRRARSRRAAAPACTTAPTTTAPRSVWLPRTSRWSTRSPTTRRP